MTEGQTVPGAVGAALSLEEEAPCPTSSMEHEGHFLSTRSWVIYRFSAEGSRMPSATRLGRSLAHLPTPGIRLLIGLPRVTCALNSLCAQSGLIPSHPEPGHGRSPTCHISLRQTSSQPPRPLLQDSNPHGTLPRLSFTLLNDGPADTSAVGSEQPH